MDHNWKPTHKLTWVDKKNVAHTVTLELDARSGWARTHGDACTGAKGLWYLDANGAWLQLGVKLIARLRVEPVTEQAASAAISEWEKLAWEDQG